MGKLHLCRNCKYFVQEKHKLGSHMLEITGYCTEEPVAQLVHKDHWCFSWEDADEEREEDI